MRKRIKKSLKRHQAQNRVRDHYRPYVPPGKEKSKVLIYADELIRLLIETLRFGVLGLETGGQFFGHASGEGVVIIDYVAGPGPAAEHSPAFFRQDISYLEQIGNKLLSLMPLLHLGEWHSHHHLGLPVPSAHDAQSMFYTLQRNREMQHYLLCIATCEGPKAQAIPYMFNRDGYEALTWDIIPGESPVRKMLEKL